MHVLNFLDTFSMGVTLIMGIIGKMKTLLMVCRVALFSGSI